MSLFCEYITETDKKESFLYKQLKAEYNNETIAEIEYNYIHSPQFKEWFGDWKSDWNNSEKTIHSELVNEQGEPRLFRDDIGDLYYKNNNGEVKFLTGNSRLESVFTSAERNDIVESFAFYFFENYLKNDYGFLDRTNVDSAEGVGLLDEALINFIKVKTDEFINDEEKINKLILLSQNILAVRKDVINYFKAKNITVDEENIEEEERVAEFNTKESFTVNSKDRAPANVKLMLSFIPKLTENFDYVRNEILNEPKFVPFERVWGLLEKELADIVPYKRNGEIVSVYDQMYNKIYDLSEIEPSLRYLVKILSDKENDPDFINMFVQAFYKSQKNFISTAVDSNKIPVGVPVPTKIFNSQVNSIDKDIVKNWEVFFYTSPSSPYNAELGTVDNVAVKNAIEGINKNIAKLAKKEDVATFNEAMANLNSFGISLSDKAVQYIVDNGRSVEILDEFLYFLEFLDKNSKLRKTNYEDNPFQKESRPLLKVAEIEAKFVPEYTENTVLGKNGMYWNYSNTNYMNLTLGLIKSGDVNEIKSRLQLPYYSQSLWLKRIAEAHDVNDSNFIENLKIHTFNNFKKEKVNDEGQDNKSINPRESMFDNIAKTFRPGGPIFNMLEPADKGSFYQIEGFGLVRTGVSEIKSVTINGKEYPYIDFQDETALNVFVNYFRSEYKRMKQVWNDVHGDLKNPILYYHTDRKGNIFDEDGFPAGNGFKSALFPQLSPKEMVGSELNKELKLFADNGEPIADDISFNDVIRLKKNIKFMIGRSIYKEYQNLIEYGLISDEGKAIALPKEALEKFEDINNPIISLVANYAVNGMISNIEMTHLFIGDPAYYKDMVDLKKRVPASYTDGMLLNITNPNDYFYNVAIVNDVTSPSTFFKEYISKKENIERIASSIRDAGGIADVKDVQSILEDYYDTNQADAQAYITPQRYMTIMKGLGKWSETKQKAFNNIINDKGSVEDYRLLAKEPLKGVYFSVQDGKPTYLKYSQAILWPRLVKNTQLAKVVDKMKSSKVDELVFVSGAKVGAQGVSTIVDENNNILDNFELNPMTLDSRFWKLQQDLKSKGMKLTDVGSQIRKNILANIDYKSIYEVDGEKLTGNEIVNSIIDTVQSLSEIGLNEVKNDLGIDELGRITDFEKLKSIIISEAQDQGENIVKAIEKGYDIDALVQVKKKVVPIIFSYIKRRVSKIQTNGGAYVQMSSFGLDKLTKKELGGVFWLKEPSELKAPHIDENGVLKPGQILISHNMIAKYIPNYTSMDREELLSRIDPEVLEMVGYRIPNQGLSSNDAMEVVGILPPETGDTIIPYTEITMKTGSDFDIDKMYIMVPNVRPIYNNKNKVIKDYVKSNYAAVASAMNRAKLISNPRMDINELADAVLNKIIENDDIIYDPAIETIKNELYKVIGNNEDAVRISYINHNGNTKLALQNRLLNLYKSILKDKKTYLEMMTSIDKNTQLLKDYINSLHPNESKSGLQHFSPTEEIILKNLLQAGKTGVGSTANNLVDHVLAQLSDMALPNLGSNGNTIFIENKPKTSIHGVYDVSNSQKITQMLSAFLNGFVDIAKDPWIVRGNYNNTTNGVAFTLLRAGFNYKYVTAFIGQPIIKDLAKYEALRNSRIGSNFKSDFIIYSLNRRYTSALELQDSEIEELLNDMKPYGGLSLELNTLENSIKDFDFEKHGATQLQILKSFLAVKALATELQENISVSKADVNGPGSTIEELKATYNKFLSLTAESKIINFDKKMVNTDAGVFFQNAVLFTNTIMKNIMIEFTPVFHSAVPTIASMLNNKKLLGNAKFIKFINEELFSYLLSKNTVLNDDNYINLFVGNNSVAKRTIRFKEDPKLKDNFFIKNLKFEFNPNGASFVGVKNTKNQPEYFKNEMTKGWKELMFSSDPKIREYANDLVKFAFYSTGFHQTLNSINGFIPHEWMQLSGFLDDINILKKDVLNGENFDFSDFMRYIMKTHYDKYFSGTSFVQNVRSDEVVSLGEVSPELKNFSKGDIFLYKNAGMYLKDSVVVGVDRDGNDIYNTKLYKAMYVNADSGMVLYAATTKLGFSQRGFSIKEYNANKPSIFKENNMLAYSKKKIDEAISRGVYIPYSPSRTISVLDDGITSIPESFNISNPYAVKFVEESKPVEVSSETEVSTESSEKPNAFADVIDDMYDYVNHSGGAAGSDSAWDTIGKELGIRMTNKHYYYGSKTLRGNVKLTEEQFEEGKQRVLEANKTLNRKPDKYMNLLARNWMQVKNADAVFAIGKLANDKIVDGGTGWAVQMAVDANKPVYLFNQKDNSWYVREPGAETFVIFNGIPTLTKNFAGIGTREINKEGLQAIEDVYNNILNPSTNTQVQQEILTEEDTAEDISDMLMEDEEFLNMLEEEGKQKKDNCNNE